MRSYRQLPALPEGGVFERYADTIGVIVPVARTNLVTNPSIELATTGYSASGSGSIARSTTDQYHGAYSLAITPGSGADHGAYFGTVSLTSGTTYAVSCKFRGVAGLPYAIDLSTTGGAILVSRTFIATGNWQWIWLFYTETSTTTRRIYFRKNGGTSTAVFYIDGVQCEACGTEGVFVTTYIDGDQRGLIANQFPPAYLWTGAPHASTSTRSGQTRAGGRVMRFKDFGWLLTALIGLGLAPVRVEAQAFAQLDGAQYQDSIKTPRAFSLAGRFVADTPQQHDVSVGQLARLLDRDRVGHRQPLVLTGQAQECGAPSGAPWSVQAVYTGGLEGNAQELPTSAAVMNFQAYTPVVFGRDGGAALTAQTSVSNANRIVMRDPAGQWAALGSGITGTDVMSILRASDGTLYAGGSFTDAGGSGADHIAAYTPTTGAWAVVGSATAINARVRSLARSPAGVIYAGGEFTNAGGVANADFIAQWNGSAWAAIGGVAGANATVFAVAVAPNGDVYAGGSFTDIGGSGADFIARWNGSAWVSLGGVTALNNEVYALAFDASGNLYAGGAFTNAGGVAAADKIAKWDGSAWTALGAGMDDFVNALAIGPNGVVYAGGVFTTAGGLSIPFLAAWNGVVWTPLGSGVNNQVSALAVAADDSLYASGTFTTAGGLTLTGAQAARWNGAAWVYVDVDLVTSPTVTAITPLPDGSLAIGYNVAVTATAAALTTVTNAGTAAALPTLTIIGPSSGTARIYQLINTTTGQAIFFDLTINAGETAVLTLDPSNITFVSTFQGNILSTILPGSTPATFVLQPGANSISFYSSGASVTAVLDWAAAYASLDDALYQVAA